MLARSISLYVVVACFLFFEMAVQVSPGIMAPELVRDLHLTTLDLGIMSSFYFYSYTAMQIPSGLLFDRFHPKVIVTIAILICICGAYLFSQTTNIYWGCAARFLMGIGSAFAWIAVLVVAGDLFPPRQFALLAGISQMLGALGAMSGQMPLSYLVESLGWRSAMQSLCVVGLALSLVVWLALTYRKRQTQPSAGLPSESIWRQLAIVFRKPQTWIIAVYACVLWAPMSGFTSLWGITYLVKSYDLSAGQAASLCSLMWIGLALFSPALGWWSTKINSRRIALTAAAALGVIAFGLILWVKVPLWLLGVLLFLAGGSCAGQAISFSVVSENNAPGQQATSIGVNNMAVVISGAIFQALIGGLIQYHAHSNDFAILTASDFQFGVVSIWVAYVIGFVAAAWFIRETLQPSQ